MTSLPADRPTLFVFAGPNGSGKSTAYRDTEIEAGERTIWIVNPDILAARIRDTEAMPLDVANLAAVQRIERWLEASIEVHKTVGVETVLSTDKYRRLVARAKTLGFLIHLIYVILDSPDRNVERVRLRVQHGGHDVPEDRIRSRYQRSLEQLPWFLAAADMALIYDNSGAKPHLMAEKRNNEIWVYPNVMPLIAQAIETASAI